MASKAIMLGEKELIVRFGLLQNNIILNPYLDILSKWFTPCINLLHQNSNNLTGWSEFVKDALFSISIAYLGIVIAFLLHKPLYSSLKIFDLINSFVKTNLKIIVIDKIINGIHDWSYNRGYIDAFYATYFLGGDQKSV